MLDINNVKEYLTKRVYDEKNEGMYAYMYKPIDLYYRKYGLFTRKDENRFGIEIKTDMEFATRVPNLIVNVENKTIDFVDDFSYQTLERYPNFKERIYGLLNNGYELHSEGKPMAQSI